MNIIVHCIIKHGSFLIYLDQTNDFSKCFVYSPMFDIPSLCEYFLSFGADINEKWENGWTPLHYAAIKNSQEVTELFLLHGENRLNTSWVNLRSINCYVLLHCSNQGMHDKIQREIRGFKMALIFVILWLKSIPTFKKINSLIKLIVSTSSFKKGGKKRQFC